VTKYKTSWFHAPPLLSSDIICNQQPRANTRWKDAKKEHVHGGPAAALVSRIETIIYRLDIMGTVDAYMRHRGAFLGSCVWHSSSPEMLALHDCYKYSDFVYAATSFSVRTVFTKNCHLRSRWVIGTRAGKIWRKTSRRKRTSIHFLRFEMETKVM
jgi:hypothetical protein